MTAALANCVAVNIRARAYAVCTLLLHALGDAISPLIIGYVSDKTGDFKIVMNVMTLQEV